MNDLTEAEATRTSHRLPERTRTDSAPARPRPPPLRGNAITSAWRTIAVAISISARQTPRATRRSGESQTVPRNGRPLLLSSGPERAARCCIRVRAAAPTGQPEPGSPLVHSPISSVRLPRSGRSLSSSRGLASRDRVGDKAVVPAAELVAAARTRTHKRTPCSVRGQSASGAGGQQDARCSSKSAATRVPLSTPPPMGKRWSVRRW
jgi:hypothetical protein